MFSSLLIALVATSIVGGFWFGYKIGRQVTINELKSLVACPHGHLDWDDCPDCCH